LGIPLLATPGPAGDALSAGCHELLRSGAAICASVDDVLLFVANKSDDPPPKPSRALPRDDLDLASARLLELLSNCPASLDELSRETGLGIARATALMTRLELDGYAERLGGTFIRMA
jgi:DNA processing protein